MATLCLQPTRPVAARPAPALEATERDLLNYLRSVAINCRAKPRADLFEACALLHVTRNASREAHAEALMRCLGEALGKRPRLHAPGTHERSFDEDWLLQLGRTLAQHDEASATFLLCARLSLPHRRLVRYLMGRIAEHFSLV